MWCSWCCCCCRCRWHLIHFLLVRSFFSLPSYPIRALFVVFFQFHWTFNFAIVVFRCFSAAAVVLYFSAIFRYSLQFIASHWNAFSEPESTIYTRIHWTKLQCLFARLFSCNFISCVSFGFQRCYSFHAHLKWI